MTNEQKSILSIRIVAAIMTVLLGIGIGYLIWHDKPVQIVNEVDKVKVDSLQNVINTLTLQLNNVKEYKVKEKIIDKTQIEKEKEKIYQALDTAARVNVFQKWVVDSSGVQYKPTQVSDTSIAIELKQMDYLTLQQYRYQNTQELLQIYKIGYYNNEPCVLFGVAKSEYGGIVWMVATEKINEVSKTNVARYSECAVKEIENRFSFLYNYVHKDNAVSINWLSWLGFTVCGEQNEFLYFYKEVG